MKKLNGEELQIGDIVKCKGISCEIASFGFNEPWEWRNAYYCEFTDTNGVYRSWKQNFDGGEAYRKGETRFVVIFIDLTSQRLTKRWSGVEFVGKSIEECNEWLKKETSNCDAEFVKNEFLEDEETFFKLQEIEI